MGALRSGADHRSRGERTRKAVHKITRLRDENAAHLCEHGPTPGRQRSGHIGERALLSRASLSQEGPPPRLLGGDLGEDVGEPDGQLYWQWRAASVEGPQRCRIPVWSRTGRAGGAAR